MKIICAVALLIISTVVGAQDCSVYLSRGIYDIHSSSSDLETSSSYAQWFCDQKFSSEEQADSFGATLSAPFKGLPVKLGFNSQSQSYSSWQSQFCSTINTNQSLKSKLKNHLETVNQGIVNAVTACLNSTGAHVWLERTGNPKVFIFAGRYNSPIPDKYPKTQIRKFDVGQNVKCNDTPTEFQFSEWRTQCTRLDNAGVVVVVNVDPGPIVGGGSLSLPPLPEPKPECKPEYLEQYYTTGNDGRKSKVISCPPGKVVEAGSGRCLRTSEAFGALKVSKQQGNNWICEWDEQPLGVGIWAEVNCLCE